MTLIATVISAHCTVHATDSLILSLRADGTRVPKEWRKGKIVRVEHLRGAMSYWGLAEHEPQKWSTRAWLREQAGRAKEFQYAADFAQNLADVLNEAILTMAFESPLHAGIGIHLTAYEHVRGYWIPELFLITNYASPSYDLLSQEGVQVSRRTWHKITGADPQPVDGANEGQVCVHHYLHGGGRLLFYNGDSKMFYHAAGGILSMMEELARRGQLVGTSRIAIDRQIAGRPVEEVSSIYRLVPKENRLVGGKPHDLAITPTGEYSSNSGD